MSKRYPFGKDIVFSFYPIDESGAAVAFSADAPTIYTYYDKPSYDQARNGTGTNQEGTTITSWTDTTDPTGGKYFTIPDIDDPEPTSSTDEQSYWVCINYTLEASQDTVTYIEEIVLYRQRGRSTPIDLDRDDIIDAYPHITTYLSNAEIDNFIDNAKSILRNDLTKMGYTWDKVKRADLLKLPTAYLTIAEAMTSQIKEESDQHDYRRSLYQDKYDKYLKGLVIPYDSDNDGETDSGAKTDTSFVFVVR